MFNFCSIQSTPASVHKICGQQIYLVRPPFSLRITHASAFRLFLLSSTSGVGNRRRWYTPWVHHRCCATNRKVPSTSTMENSWSPFCWQHASPLVRTKAPCNLNSQIHVSQTICSWRSQPPHSAVCTDRVLQNRLPTRPVQKAVQAYLTFWLWKIVTDTLMRLQMFLCGFSQFSWWCLHFSPLKEYKPGYVPFCVCQALYQRAPHLLRLMSTNQFLLLSSINYGYSCALIHSRGTWLWKGQLSTPHLWDSARRHLRISRPFEFKIFWQLSRLL